MSNQPVKLIQSVQRAIDILNCFSENNPRLSLNELSEHASLHINTARGLINTLTANGLIIHDKQNNLYGLGFYFIGKTNIIQKQLTGYITMFKGAVDNIANKYHISASLQLVNQDQIYSVYCAYPANTAYYIILSEYAILPKYATSSGKLLLLYNDYPHGEKMFASLNFKQFTPKTITDPQILTKELQEIRRQGYAGEFEEFAFGVGSLAVPVFGTDKALLATVSATFFAHAFPEIKTELLADLQKIAADISANFVNKHTPAGRKKGPHEY